MDLKQTLRHMESYLAHRKHRVTVNKFFSESEGITTRVLRSSRLGYLLFNIFNDIFLSALNSSLNNNSDNLKKIKNNLRNIYDKETAALCRLSSYLHNSKKKQLSSRQ